MANIMLRHESIAQATEEMSRAAQDMQSAFEDLMNRLAPLASSFSGAAAEAFDELSRNRGMIYQDLTDTFGTGANALGRMHESIIDGDRKGAGILGG